MADADESHLDERIRGYDWAEAFGCCGAKVSPAAGSSASSDPVNREDVDQIVALSEGCNDGPEWMGVFHLSDGRFAFLAAWCDYTGWDCQSGGYTIVSHDLEHLIRLGLTTEARDRLGLATRDA